MKLKPLITALTAFTLWALAMNLNAQLVQTVTITLMVTHPYNATDVNNVTTFTSRTEAHTTAELLKILAEDEFAAGNLTSSNLPAGAKLVVSNGVFQIMTKTNTLLVDVSSILSFSSPSPYAVQSGRQNDNNFLASPSLTTVHIGTLTFDDTAITGGQDLQFYLQGVTRETTTDIVNTRAGTYIETDSASLVGAGDGTSDGGAFIITGTVTATGRTPSLPIPIISSKPK